MDMITCQYCQSKLSSERKVCPYCGTMVEREAVQKNIEQNHIDVSHQAEKESCEENALARQIRLQNEIAIAMQKRNIISQMQANKERRIKRTILFAVVAFVAVCLIITAIDIAYWEIERNFDVDEISDECMNVYADIVYFEPYYIIEETEYKGNIQIGEAEENRILCKCRTVGGKTVWLEIWVWDYTGTIEYRGENPTSDYDVQYFDEPIRVRGFISTFQKEIDNAPEGMEDTLVLFVSNIH